MILSQKMDWSRQLHGPAVGWRSRARTAIGPFPSKSASIRGPLFAFPLLVLMVGFPSFAMCAEAQETSTTSDSASATPPSRVDPEAQKLLDRAVEALGGEAFLNAKNMRTRGRTFAIAEGSTAAFARFESTVQFPDKRRFSYGKDKPVTLINDGERGWQLDRYGMIRQPDEQLRRWKLSARYSVENILRQVIHEPGLLVQASGSEFTDNLAAQVVDIIDAEQVRIKLYLHTVNARPIRVAYRLQNPKTREWEEYAAVYGDYKRIQGIETPMHVTRFLNGERYGETFRNAAEYNLEIPANYFSPAG